MSSIAICDRTLERTNEGRIEAKVKGVKFGRKRTVNRGEVYMLLENGMGATEISRQVGVGRSTVYKIINEKDR